MENASKALLIAGGVLSGILILSLLVFMFTSISNNAKSKEEIKIVEQLTAYNKEFESYNRKLLRGTDVVSLINKAISTNKKYDNIEEYYINIQFEMKEELVYISSGTTSSKVKFDVNKTYDINSFNSIKNNEEAFKDFKRRIFDCTEIEYNKINGRVCRMKFVERIDYSMDIMAD